MSACILPLAPDWQPPPEQENHPPVFVGTNPSAWTIVTPPIGSELEFSVTLADDNEQDDLYLRVIADYPPYNPDFTRLQQHEIPAPINRKERDPKTFSVGCFSLLLHPDLQQHRILVAVSDRPFRSDPGVPPGDLEAISAGAHLVKVGWLLNLECR
jgi:hypothetical protein